MIYAKRVDANQPEIVDALRAFGCEVESMHRFGGGWPDLLVYVPAFAHLHLLEIKDPKRMRKPESKAKLSPTEMLQLEFRRRFPVAVVSTVDEALAACGMVVT